MFAADAPLVPDLSGLFTLLAAESVLILAVPAVLVADLFAKSRGRKEAAAGTVALGAFIAAFFLCLFQAPDDSGSVTPLLRADSLAKVFRLIALLSGVIGTAMALRGGDVRRHRTEFFVCLLGAVLGACLTAAANDLVMLYLAIETLSIAGYLLAGFKRNHPQGAEAAMKYILFGAISSGLMLYGMSLLYGFAGSTALTAVAGQEGGSLMATAGTSVGGSPAFIASAVLVFGGLAYKVAAAPFQFWCPDVYQGSPTAVAGFLAVAGKGAGFAALIRFVDAATGGGVSEGGEALRLTLLGMALLTMTVGNLAALWQRDTKRILAYSAIAHAGYLLLGLTVLRNTGTAAIVFYMAVYLFMTFGAFFMVSLVERERGSVQLEAFNGLGFKAPLLAVCMGVFLIGLTGLPPTGGFVGKFYLFKEVFDYGGALSAAGESGASIYFWAGVIGLLNGVVSLVYYARFLMHMYLTEDAEETPPMKVGGIDKGLMCVFAVPVLVLGVAFAALYGTATAMSWDTFAEAAKTATAAVLGGSS